MKIIPLIKPYITKEVKDKVIEVLNSGYLTEGPVTKRFEEVFRSYIGCNNAIAVTSCTTGLELALRALEVGPGDEVIIPDYTYPATADVVSIVGANCVIVDVSPDTMLIDYDAIESAINDRTKAIIPVSIFGNPLNYNRLDNIKRRFGLFLVEDAACSIGSEYSGKKVGNHADITVFSFHPRKFITTGEGGMITTNNDKWATWMESYKHFGMDRSDSREGMLFMRIGTNYKLSNLLSAIGLSQMGFIDELLKRRRMLAKNYTELLKDTGKIKIPKVTSAGKHSFQSFCVFLENRDCILKQMRSEGIEVQIGTYSLHMQPAFRNLDIREPLEGSRYAWRYCLTLPLYHELSRDDQQYVVNKLKSFL